MPDSPSQPRRDEPTAPQRRWLAASSALGAVIAFFVASPLVRNPPLQPDDFRYLEGVRTLQHGFWSHLLDASIVENRWDQLWWIDVPGSVRFFRPTVILSYFADVNIWRERYATGLIATNFAIYLACILLVAWLLNRWIGPGVAAVAGTALFAALHAHGEVVYYAAGRTDSLAGLLFLSVLALHSSSRSRWWALPLFALAGLTKELTLSLPLLLFLHDLWIARRSESAIALLRSQWKLFAAYGLVAIGVVSARAVAIGAQGGHPFPYFVLPFDSRFPGHAAAQLLSYSANLLLGGTTASFSVVPPGPGLVSILLAIALLGAVGTLLRADRRFWWFAMAGAITYGSPHLNVGVSAGALVEHRARAVADARPFPSRAFGRFATGFARS